jgi:hypothetical protein
MMKINKFLSKVRTRNAALLALCVFVLGSCLKDKAPGNQDYSGSPALVSFQYTGNGAVPYIAAIPGTATDTSSIEVTLSAQSVTEGFTVTLSVVPYKAGLDSFNTANGTSYVQMDPSLYTLQNGGNVTVSPGQQYVTIRINLAGNKIDFTKKNGIGLQITNAQGANIASNLNTAIVLIALKSKYEGNYHVFGTRIHPVLGPFTFDYIAYMSTVDGITIDGAADADLQTDLQIHVNPDNSVTLSSSSPYYSGLQAGKENDYNPATKTFVLNYFYNTGAPRLIHETLVAQ